MVSTLSGALANIVLDPVFLYPLHMGMTGAAVATVLGQLLAAALSLCIIVKTCRELPPEREGSLNPHSA